jgi:Ala-tRNA(Pro) deacylase
MNLDQFLSSCRVPFEHLRHRPAYTANRVAQMLHSPGGEVAKTVLLRTDRGYLLAVLPATHHVDLDEVRREMGVERVEMASEADMERLFPDCERGTVPPFGSLYRLETIVDDSLSQDERIVFDAQCHEDAIRMSYRDYENVEHPRRGHFAHHV